jgi:hypothetical protein
MKFERGAPGKYVAVSDDRQRTFAYIHRFQTAWIAWNARTHEPIRGPFGLGGSPFRTLSDAKRTIRAQFGEESCHVSS